MRPSDCHYEYVVPQVEFLLLECLQDLTGGGPAFYLASYSLMVDITNTNPDTRTRRLSILDSFIPIGFLTGLPLGTFLKNQFGYVLVFCVGCLTVLLCILYVVFLLKEEVGPSPGGEDKDGELTVKLNKGQSLFSRSRSLLRNSHSMIFLQFYSVTFLGRFATSIAPVGHLLRKLD